MAEYREGYGLVLQRVMRDPSLSVEAKAIYAYLCTFADADGICYPQVATMRSELGMCENRFYKHMKQLTSAGVVKVRKTRDGSRFAKNHYEVVRPVFIEKSGTDDRGMEKKGTVLQAPFSEVRKKSGVDGLGTNITSMNNTRNINIPSNEYVRRLCDLLNEGKRKASSKGRLKVETGVWIIRDLVRAGISQAAILEAAQEAAATGMDLDWFSFETYCKKR